MGCGASRNGKVMPEGVVTVATLQRLGPPGAGPPGAPDMDSLTSSDFAVWSWQELVKEHGPSEGGNGGTGTTLDHIHSAPKDLCTAGTSVIWDDAALELIADSVLVAKRSNRLNLSPALRAQLWLAFSRVDARSQNKASTAEADVWGINWYDDALARADAMSAAKSTSSSDATLKAFQVIDNDVPRTLHNFSRFVYPDSALHDIVPPPDKEAEQAALARVLRAFCIVCPNINYTQGMNFIAELILLVLWFADRQAEKIDRGQVGALKQSDPATPSTTPNSPGKSQGAMRSSETPERRRERRACGMLRVLANDMGMSEMWSAGFPLLNSISESLMEILAAFEPGVESQLSKNGLPPSSYTTSWLITMFTSGPELKFTSPADVMLWWDLLWVECCRPKVARWQLQNENQNELLQTASWRHRLVGAGSRAAACTVLLRTTYLTLLCHKDIIARAKDVVEIMTELRRGLTSEELSRTVFEAGDGSTRDVFDRIVADRDGKWVK
eukprot:g3471.t1